VKPTRSTTGNRIGSLTRDRRIGLIALGIMLIMLAALLIYQRVTTEPGTPLDQPINEQRMEVEATMPETEAPGVEVPEAIRQPLTQLAYPLASDWNLVKEYGSTDEAFGDFRIFSGLAVAAAPHTPVLAGGPGRVIEVEQDPLDGGAVVIDHAAGLQSRYAGLGQILVHLDQDVISGQEIGQIAGSSAGIRQSLGSHLYLQVFKDGDVINPLVYFPN